MSNNKLNKPFKHFDTLDTFISTKVSVGVQNTSYTQNGTISTGVPDIKWEDLAFINDVGQIWNRGRFYNAQKYLNKLAVIAKNTSYDYNKPIITIIDKSYAKLYDKYISVYNNYPGILPSIVVAPGVVEQANNINKAYALIDKGCDVLSTAYDNVSVYNSTKTFVQNYAEIQNDIVQVQEWLIDHSMFTDCYMYPNATVCKEEADFISKYEEYGIVETTESIDILDTYDKQDNMLFKGFSSTTVAGTVTNLEKAMSLLRKDIWIILIVDSSKITGDMSALVSKINTYVNNDKAIYLQVNEALKMFAPRFNICRSSELPFRVYKDGTVDAILTTASQRKIFDALKEDFMKYNAEHLHSYMATYMNTYFLQIDKPA